MPPSKKIPKTGAGHSSSTRNLPPPAEEHIPQPQTIGKAKQAKNAPPPATFKVDPRSITGGRPPETLQPVEGLEQPSQQAIPQMVSAPPRSCSTSLSSPSVYTNKTSSAYKQSQTKSISRDEFYSLNARSYMSPSPMPEESVSSVDVGPISMSMKPSAEGLKFHIRSCIKELIFRRVKFLDKDTHGDFDEAPHTVCGMVIDFCYRHSPTKNETMLMWWKETRPVVFRLHTDHRNNCIKTMKSAYKGNCCISCKFASSSYLSMSVDSS
jgi:hypothetical protein